MKYRSIKLALAAAVVAGTLGVATPAYAGLSTDALGVSSQPTEKGLDSDPLSVTNPNTAQIVAGAGAGGGPH